MLLVLQKKTKRNACAAEKRDRKLADVDEKERTTVIEKKGGWGGGSFNHRQRTGEEQRTLEI